MRVIHVLRKPLSEGSVAANVLKHGTGAIHIDACRVSFTSTWDEQDSKGKNQHAAFGTPPLTGNAVYGDYSMRTRLDYNPPGRWPANLILQHLDGCRLVGSTGVKSDGHYPASRPSGSDVSGPSGHTGQDGLVESYTKGEAVPVWDCAPGCPVAGLDVLHSQDPATRKGRAGKHGLGDNPTFFGLKETGDHYGDVGGASRFFKQIGGDDGPGEDGSGSPC